MDAHSNFEQHLSKKMGMFNNAGHVFTVAKAKATAATLNADGDGYTYKVIPLPSGMAKVAVYDEAGIFVEYW